MPVLERISGETRAKVLNQTFPRNKRYKVALADGIQLRVQRIGPREHRVHHLDR